MEGYVMMKYGIVYKRYNVQL